MDGTFAGMTEAEIRALTKIKMYVRVDPMTRARFKAIAGLNGQTMEGRLERLMLDDIEANLPGLLAPSR